LIVVLGVVANIWYKHRIDDKNITAL
jgi:hypothetical protein